MKRVIKNLKYIGLVVLGFLFLVMLWFVFFYLYQNGENEVYILPNNYKGGVIVLFDVDNGQEVKYNKNAERLYEIPDNGILKTKFELQDNKWLHNKYFYRSGQELRYLIPSDMVWKDSINVNSKYKDSIYTYRESVGGGNLWFLVGNPKEINKNYKILNKMSDKLPPNTKE